MNEKEYVSGLSIASIIFLVLFVLFTLVTLIGYRFENAPWAILHLIFLIWSLAILRPSGKPGRDAYKTDLKIWKENKKQAKKKGFEFNEVKPSKKDYDFRGQHMPGLYIIGLIVAFEAYIFLGVMGSSMPLRYPPIVKDLKAQTSMYEVFPDKIPSEAENVKFRHLGSFLQGRGYTYVDYEINSDYIDKFISDYGQKVAKLYYVPMLSKYAAITRAEDKYVNPHYDPEMPYVHPEKMYDYRETDLSGVNFYRYEELSTQDQKDLDNQVDNSKYCINFFMVANDVDLPADGTLYLLYDNDNWNHHSCVGFWVNDRKTRIRIFEY